MKINEQSQQEDERENLSGSDDFEAWMHEQETEFPLVLAESDSTSA